MARTGGKRKTDPGYGRGEVSLAFNDDVLLDEDTLTARLIEVFSNPAYQPPTLPAIASELMSLSQNPNANIQNVAALLEQDAFLAGRVMKIVQSPVYLAASDIPSLHNAIVRLGLNTLRDIVLETCMNLRVFRADSYTDTMERVRCHSVYVGHLSRILCQSAGVDQEFAFLCGLLHDVGIAGAITALTEGTKKEERPDLIAIWPAIDGAHSQAGSLMVKLWDLPETVQQSVAVHHQVGLDDDPDPLAAAVCLADEMAHELGVGLVAPHGEELEGVGDLEAACLQSHTRVDRSTPKTLERCRQVLDLSAAQLEILNEEAVLLAERIAMGGNE